MLKNYLKIAFRNLKKYKGYSFINFAGLAVGLASCILISQYIYQELSYDSFFKDADRVYRVATMMKSPNGIEKNAQTSMPVGPALAANYSEIRSWTRMYYAGPSLVENRENKFFEYNIVFADSTFFKIFPFKILSGDPENLLNAPNSIVLTKSMAHKYFGRGDAIGKTLRINNKQNFLVTGVMEDVPVNTHFHFGFVASYSSLTPGYMGWDPSKQWGAFFDNFTYILVPSKFDAASFQRRTKPLLEGHNANPPGVSSWLVYQPLKKLHLLSGFVSTPELTNSSRNLFVVAIIGLFTLLIACINFINITTARSSQRLKEIGVRKALGAQKSGLVMQFIGESLLTSVLSLLFAVMIVEVMLPAFSNLVGEKIVTGLFSNPLLLTVIVVTTCLIGVVSGIYPALMLSRIKTSASVKGKTNKGGCSLHSLMRKTLVVVQFSISSVLIVAAIVINDQVKYAKDSDLGFNRNDIVQISVRDQKVRNQFKAFENEVSAVPGVEGTSKCFCAPVSHYIYATDIYPNGHGQQGAFTMNFDFVDANFIKLFGIKLLAGRNFEAGHPSDSASIIINETAMRNLGFVKPQEAVGRKYSIGINNWRPQIIGVVKDFHFSSFHNAITPFAFMDLPGLQRQLSVKINSADISGALAGIKSVWEKFSQAYPFQYSFINETVDELYKRDVKEESIVAVFSGIAILTACLGLFGLVAFSAEQRTKEIGIRKVLGASTSGIVGLLSREFLMLTLSANIIALPLAGYVMNGWLNDFAYRIHISPFTFVITAAVTVSITILTISFQAIKAAATNPVKSLRYE